jgi:hypothetical protein
MYSVVWPSPKIRRYIGDDKSYMEAVTHRRWAEIAAEKWSPFRSHRGFAAPNLLLDTIPSLWHEKWRTGEDDQRGGEWEPIKIPRENLAYIPNQTQHASLLTRSRPLSYWEAVGHQNRVRYQDHSNSPKQSKQSYMWDFGKPKLNQQAI